MSAIIITVTTITIFIIEVCYLFVGVWMLIPLQESSNVTPGLKNQVSYDECTFLITGKVIQNNIRSFTLFLDTSPSCIGIS